MISAIDICMWQAELSTLKKREYTVGPLGYSLISRMEGSAGRCGVGSIALRSVSCFAFRTTAERPVSLLVRNRMDWLLLTGFPQGSP